MGSLYRLGQKFVDFCNVVQQNVNNALTVPSSAVLYSALKGFQSGYFVVELGASGGSYDQYIAFEYPYEQIPMVVASLSDVGRGSASTPKTDVGITSITGTGVNFRIKSDSVTAGSITVYWLAMPRTQPTT